MFQHINTYQVPNIDHDVPGIITESEYEKLEKRKSSVCTGVCVSVLIPHPPEMSVDYVQALYWYTTAVVVTNYETDCCKNWYVHRKNVPFQVQQYVSRLQSAVSVIPL